MRRPAPALPSPQVHSTPVITMAMRAIAPEDAEAFGKSVYERKVRPTLNGAAEPVGCYLSVDLDSADWELDESRLQAALRLRARRLDADIFTPHRLSGGRGMDEPFGGA